MRRSVLLLPAVALLVPGRGPAPAAPAGELGGTVTSTVGRPIPGVWVTVRRDGIARTVFTDGRGRYRLAALTAGRYTLEAWRVGFAPARREGVEPNGRPRVVDLALEPATAIEDQLPSSAWLGLLPEGEDKRRFVLDCTGCHQFDRRIVEPNGAPRTEASWRQRIHQMLQFAGWTSGFPIIAASRDPDATAVWLARYLHAGARIRLRAPAPPTPETAPVTITEYDLPRSSDLPHDLVVDGGGRVVVTGMFSHVMYVLDPASGRFDETAIPVPNANPRAVELGPAGDWWVLLGMPQRAAHRTPSGEWRSFELGMYPHSMALDEAGGLWFNGHFTKRPGLLARLDPATGEIRRWPVPESDRPVEASGPIPYEIRRGPDGTIWGSELAGNRVYRFDPGSDRFTTWHMPTPHSGPRRLDVGPDGVVWIPEYSGNALTRLDPATGRFTRYPFPTPDALPYVVRVDRTDGLVWIGTAASDALASFDPTTERFTEYPLPTRGALIRHLDIDRRTGAVWGAYSPGPAVAPKIVRIERGGPPRRRRG